MSTTVDNRVLEMRFDNAQFEKGVSTSMSTLDKLKQKLNLSGASKGLEGIGKAAKKVSFSGLVAGADAVNVHFSHMQMSIQHQLDRIVDSCIHAGKRMVSALTIDPVKSGFQEYETQINSVQTILANTQSKGTTLDQVNAALDELNAYADKTIYNFTEMTRNIGTFTAAGIDLETSVSAIQGIANLAAVSGSTSQQASTAMYQLSQALATGTIRLMDWNSVVNAGMGGEVFQTALKKTSELLGTGAEAAIKAKGSFRESLQEGWLTAEVLTQTLQKMTTSGANEYVAEYTGLTVEAVEAAIKDAEAKYGEADAIKEASKALAEKSGKNVEEIEETLQMAKTAEEAATKVKTFTQLMDTLKEAIQSGWTQTWEILIGDFEEAKELFTDISDTLGEFINKTAETRNTILEGAMTSNWDKLIKKVNEAGVDTDTFNEKVKAIAEEGGVDIDKLIAEYGSLEKVFQKGAVSSDILTKALKEISGAATELEGTFKIGDGMDEASEDVKKLQTALEKAGFTLTEFGADGKFGKETEEAVKAFQKAKGLTADGIVGPETLNAIKEASGVTGKLASDAYKLAANIDQLGGRQNIIDGFSNAFSGLTAIFTAIGNAWEEVFPSGTIEERADKVAKLTESFRNFTEKLIPTEETVNDVTRTFKGLFAVLDIIRTLAGGGLSIAFKVLSAILGAFDTDILELTANVGDALVGFRDFLFEENALAKGIDGLVDKLPGAIAQFKEWFNTFKETPAVQKFLDAIENIKEAFANFSTGEIDLTELAQSLGTNIANALMSIPDIAIQIGKDVIAGFQNGIEEGISGTIIGKIISFCTEFIASFKETLGVHSPSTITEEIGSNTIQGFINGIEESLAPVLGVITYIGEQIINAFNFIWDQITDESGNIEWDKIFAGGLLIGGLLIVKQFADAMKGISDGIGGIGDILEGAGKSLKSFSKVLNGYAWDLKAKAIQKMAISIAILAAAVWAIAQIDDPTKLWTAVGVIGALAAIVLALAGAMELMSKSSITYEKGKLNIEGLKASILQIGATLLMLGVVVKLIGSMNPEQAKQGFIGLTAMMLEVIAFMAVVGLVVKGGATENIDKVGKLMTKLAFAMMLMTLVVKLSSGLSGEEMLKGATFAIAFGIFVVAITKVAKSAGNNVSKVGGMILKITIAMGLMVGVLKLVGLLSPGEMLKGALFASAFAVFVNILVKSTAIGKKQQIAKLGGLLMSISFSLLLMVGVCKLVGMLSTDEILKGAVFVGAFLIFLRELIKITTSSGKGEIVKLGGTILALSVAIGILAGVAALLGMIDIGGLAKGIIAVGALSTFMSIMVKSLKGVKASKSMASSLMKLVIAIGAMALAVVALSLIDTEDLAASTIALVSLMGMFALMEKNMKGLKKVKVGPIVTLTLVVGAIAGIIYLLKGLNPEASIGIAKSMSLLLASLSVSALVLSKINPASNAALPAAAKFIALITVVGGILAVLGGLIAKIDGAEKFLNNGLPILKSIGSALGSLIGGIIGGIGEGITGTLPTMGQNIADFMDKLATASENASGIKSGSFNGVSELMKVMGEIGLTTVGTTISDIFTLGGTSMEKFETDGVAFFNAMKSISEASAGINLDEAAMTSIIAVASMLSSLQSSIEPIGGVMDWFGGRDDLATFGENIGQFIESMKTAFLSLDGVSFNTAALMSIITGAATLSGLQSTLEPIGGVISWFKGKDDLGTFGTNVASFIESMKTAFASLTDVNFNVGAMSVIITAATKLSELQSSLTPMDGILSWFTGDKDLSTFGTKVSEFITSMSTAASALGDVTINEAALTSIITAASKLSELQSSLDPMDGILSWFTGDRDLSTFGTKVSEFITSMTTVASSLGDTTINEAALTSIITAATKLSELQSSLDNMDGVITWFTGKSDLGTFGEKIGEFATAMGTLKTNMGEGGISEATITSITNAGGALVALQEALPKEGWFDGKLNLTDFSTYITDFATAMSTFGTTANEIDSAAISTAISAAYNIKYLIEAIADLDTSGVGEFTGIGPGGPGADGVISDIAEAIADFSNKLGDIDSGNILSATTVAMRLKTLISDLSSIDSSGVENFKIDSIGSSMKTYGDNVKDIDTTVVASSITSATRLKDFIASLIGLDSSGIVNFKVGSIGTTIKSYSDSVKDVDSSAITKSITAANKIKSFIATLAGLDPSGISKFKTGDIGSSLKNYSTSVSGLDGNSIANSITAANKIKDFISSLAGLDISGVSSFASAVDSLGSVSVNDVAESFSNSSDKMSSAGSSLITSIAKGMKTEQSTSSISTAAGTAITSAYTAIASKASDFLKAGASLMEKLATGLNSQKMKVSSIATSAVSSAASAIRIYYNNFYVNGSYLGSGLVSGINSKQTDAYNAGYQLGQAAVRGEKDGQQSNSPSKLTIKAGKWLGEGLIIGVKKMGAKVGSVCHNLGDNASSSISNAIGRVSDFLNSDIDSNPTISPVLDLTNVRSGVGEISGLFNGKNSIGVMANLGSISASMDRRNQNGTMSDVISAIDKMRKDLNSKDLGNTTYSIGGVTYDQGTEVSEAISTLVRALRIEGRV